MTEEQNNLAALLGLEKDNQPLIANNHEALQLGNELVRLATENDDHIRIKIVLDGETVFYHLMDGKGKSPWLDRKLKTVFASRHSSFYVYQANESEGLYQDWLEDEDYAVCGGGFPIWRDGQLVGAIAVSGLAHERDHELILVALANLSKS